jgi:hypothetical protein
MSYSPLLGSSFNRTKLRDPQHVSTFSGMCSMCTADCVGTCEIGISAVRGADAVYPTTTGDNQVASEKVYPIDYSHFNINGRVFGAVGAEADSDKATIRDVNLETEIGTLNPVKLKLPIILPALIKLNWQDYFGGAAMAGVLTVIGEGAVTKDPTLKLENGKVVHCPKLGEFLDAFRKYYRGYGQIILQVNVDDDDDDRSLQYRLCDDWDCCCFHIRLCFLYTFGSCCEAPFQELFALCLYFLCL